MNNKSNAGNIMSFMKVVYGISECQSVASTESSASTEPWF